MSKIYFYLCKNSDGTDGWKMSNQPHQGSIAIDSSQQVYTLCPIHKGNMIHLKEIRGIRAVFQCCACRKEMNNPKFAVIDAKGHIEFLI